MTTENLGIRQPFVFVLAPNFDPQLTALQLVYRVNPPGIIERLTPVFFIGISGKKIITGPYKLTGGIIHDENSQPRKAMRTREIDQIYPDDPCYERIKLTCPYKIPFKPLVPIKYGIKWEILCGKFNIAPIGWGCLIRVKLTLEQIQELTEWLTRINTN